MAKITVRTNGQTLKVNASISHWTSAALAVVASGDDDIPSSATTTIGADYDMHFANTATTATVTVKQLDGTTLLSQTFEVNPGVGPRVLSPMPDASQAVADGVRRDLTLAPAGALAETHSRAAAVHSNTAGLTSGQLRLVGIHLTAGTVVTNITFMSGTTAANTPTNWWFALYNSSLALLGQTADQTNTAWAANTAKTVALASPYTVTSTGLYYLGLMMAAATPITMMTAVSSGVGPLALSPILVATSTGSLTDTAPNPAGALTAATGLNYAYVS